MVAGCKVLRPYTLYLVPFSHLLTLKTLEVMVGYLNRPFNHNIVKWSSFSHWLICICQRAGSSDIISCFLSFWLTLKTDNMGFLNGLSPRCLHKYHRNHINAAKSSKKRNPSYQILYHSWIWHDDRKPVQRDTWFIGRIMWWRWKKRLSQGISLS